ncbi:MAG: hemolysin family protein, partial [Hyphococcus sp.]
AASAFFSGSETALFSLSRFDLQRLSRAREPAAGPLHQLLEQPRRLIVSILCGNELINIAAAANMTAILVELMGAEAAVWTALFVMVPLILLFGEVTPKTLAVSNPVWASTRIVAAPMQAWVRFAAPLAYVVRALADRVTTLIIGPERTKENILHVDELRMLIEEGVQSGEVTATERLLVHGLISAGATEVSKIMTPRAEVAFIDGDLDDAEIRERFFALRRARVPVFRGTRDEVDGFLYVEDLLDTDHAGKTPGGLRSLLHPPIAVPATKQAEHMLDFFEERGARAALVVNEFGAVEGMVTLSDVTRLLFAEVFEEAAAHAAEIVEIEGGYDVEGRGRRYRRRLRVSLYGY